MRSILTFLLLGLTVSIIAQNAYIEVKAEPGISVFIDSSFKGKTNTDIGGLIIENITPGSHVIKVLKDGFNPQEEKINVKAGEVYTYAVRPFIPKLKISETGNTGQQDIDLKVGKLKIQSLPVAITIIIPTLGLSYNKSQDEWNVDEMPVGRYVATFKGMNKTLTDTIVIDHNQLTHLFVNMINGKIEHRITAYPTNTVSDRSSDENMDLSNGSFKDSRDGKVYKAVQIGDQVWMAENMAYKPADGNYWAFEDNSSNVAIYGYLYDWETAKKVCPSGWHLPDETEWDKLISQQGEFRYAAAQLKERGISHWKSPNSGATNKSAFTALPGGICFNYPTEKDFSYPGHSGCWWSSTEFTRGRPWSYEMTFEYSHVIGSNVYSKEFGLSVRCLKDQ